MVALQAEKQTYRVPARGSKAVLNFGLSLLAAVLQIATTIAVVQAMPPAVAGIYFKGVVICYGLAAVLRGKYDLFATHYFIGGPNDAIPVRDLVRGLGIRVLTRSAIACAILLVITTDLDVVEPHLRPFLQTYLPFVLAVPFATVAFFLAMVLRAANRFVSSFVAAAYSINIIVLAVASSVDGSNEEVLLALSWGFFVGAVLAAGVAVLITRKIFPKSPVPSRRKLDAAGWREIYVSAGRHGLTGLTYAVLQWGPVCVLALLGSEVEVAHYAAATRTAQVIDFLLPAALLVPQAFLLHSRFADTMRTVRGKLAMNMAVSLATTTLSVLAVAVATPWIIGRFGPNYDGLADLFVLLFATQWVTGVCRPAIGHIAMDWSLSQVRRILLVSMLVAVALSLVAISMFGSLGAAISVFAGAVVLNGQVLLAAFASCRRSDASTRPPV
jgi:O-antigen/teichoic acid export membrane protein